MIKKLLVVLIILAMGYTSCKKNIVLIPLPAPASSYFPQTKGSTWAYRDSTYNITSNTLTVNGSKIAAVTFTMTGDITNFNNSFYYNAALTSNIDGASTAYVYVLNHKIALREPVVSFGILNLEILNDTASVGYTWISAPTDNSRFEGDPIQTINTIQEKGITRVINGTTYINITHTSVNLQVNEKGAGFHNMAYFDFYLAKNVGLVEANTYAYGSYNSIRTIEGFITK